MTSKHTPGPWTVGRIDNSIQLYVLDGAEHEDPCDGIIAAVDMSAADRNLPDANARLIAAAPELLGALRFALAVLNALDGNTAQERAAATLRGQLAITKAEGEAS